MLCNIVLVVGNYVVCCCMCAAICMDSGRICVLFYISKLYLQCFDAVGWLAGRASGL